MIGLIVSLLLQGVTSAPTCPVGSAFAQKLGRTLESNGCTKPAFLTVNGEEDFTHCCDRHDVCYSTCGLTQAYCDEDFRKCMHQLCEHVFPHNPECKSAASTYSMGTSLFGTDLYSNEQDSHCTCIEAGQLVPHYKSYVDLFYKTFVTDSIKDANDILTEKSKYLQNSGTESSPRYKNIHKIVYDLHKKYDNAIGHIDARKSKKEIPKPPVARKEL